MFNSPSLLNKKELIKRLDLSKLSFKNFCSPTNNPSYPVSSVKSSQRNFLSSVNTATNSPKAHQTVSPFLSRKNSQEIVTFRRHKASDSPFIPSSPLPRKESPDSTMREEKNSPLTNSLFKEENTSGLDSSLVQARARTNESPFHSHALRATPSKYVKRIKILSQIAVKRSESFLNSREFLSPSDNKELDLSPGRQINLNQAGQTFEEDPTRLSSSRLMRSFKNERSQSFGTLNSARLPKTSYHSPRESEKLSEKDKLQTSITNWKSIFSKDRNLRRSDVPIYTVRKEVKLSLDSEYNVHDRQQVNTADAKSRRKPKLKTDLKILKCFIDNIASVKGDLLKEPRISLHKSFTNKKIYKLRLADVNVVQEVSKGLASVR